MPGSKQSWAEGRSPKFSVRSIDTAPCMSLRSRFAYFLIMDTVQVYPTHTCGLVKVSFKSLLLYLLTTPPSPLPCAAKLLLDENRRITMAATMEAVCFRVTKERQKKTDKGVSLADVVKELGSEEAHKKKECMKEVGIFHVTPCVLLFRGPFSMHTASLLQYDCNHVQGT